MKIKLLIKHSITHEIIIDADYCHKHYVRKDREYNITKNQEIKRLHTHNQELNQAINDVLEFEL